MILYTPNKDVQNPWDVVLKQARNQSGQTKPYVSRLGSYQCCTLKIEISDCNEFGFFGQLLDIDIQKNISYLTDNFRKQGYKVLFFPAT